MPAFSSLDLRDLDVDAAARELRGMTDTVAAAATGFAREAAYTAVGLGLLAYQRAQTRRRDIEREMRRSA